MSTVSTSRIHDIVHEYSTVIRDTHVLFPPIPERPLNGAVQKYARDVEPDTVLVLVDNTFSHKGKEGLLLTDTTLYGKLIGSKRERIAVADIKTATIGRKHTLHINGRPFVALGLLGDPSLEALVRMLEEIAHACGSEESGPVQAVPETDEPVAARQEKGRLGECPKCGGDIRAKTASINPFGLLIPVVGVVEKVAKCADCGYIPPTWNGEKNVARLTPINPGKP